MTYPEERLDVINGTGRQNVASCRQAQGTQASLIGKLLDNGMVPIEEENPSLNSL